MLTSRRTIRGTMSAMNPRAIASPYSGWTANDKFPYKVEWEEVEATKDRPEVLQPSLGKRNRKQVKICQDSGIDTSGGPPFNSPK